MAVRKILYSPGFGAGWVSWNCTPTEMSLYLLTYQPIIDFLEAGNSFVRGECVLEWERESDVPNYDKVHPILATLHRECQEKFGSTPYMGGAHQLKVVEVDGEVRIDDYDGFESVNTRYDTEGWL